MKEPLDFIKLQSRDGAPIAWSLGNAFDKVHHDPLLSDWKGDRGMALLWEMNQAGFDIVPRK